MSYPAEVSLVGWNKPQLVMSLCRSVVWSRVLSSHLISEAVSFGVREIGEG